jgi:hypothetical protein
MLKSILHAYQPEFSPRGWYGATRADISALGLICHAIWILTCIILFIIYYHAEIAVINDHKFWLFDYRVVFCDVLFHCDVIDMHFLHACWYWYAFFAQRADMGNCDVTHITPCKFCIITTKYLYDKSNYF